MRKFVMMTVAAVALLTMLSVSDASAQGRGRGHGNGKWENGRGNDNSKWNKGRGNKNWKWGNKCDKFVNCHDARDGRWDNRGPRRRLTWRSRHFSRLENVRFSRRQHGRRINADRFYVRSRRRF